MTDSEPGTSLAPRAAVPNMLPFDPFQMMDRFDEDAFTREMEGRVAEELVYVVKDGAKEVVGLSKAGIDECCMALVGQGQVIREEDIKFELKGEGEAQEALFRCWASRYSVSVAGGEVRLDQVIGVKRQPLYYEQASELTLDSTVPSKKYRGKTYRDLLADDEGRDYLGWMAYNWKEQDVRDFVTRALAGEDVRALPGRRLNPHWYEHGCMKAARNARFRLIPGTVRASVIQMAVEAGKVRRGEAPTPVVARVQAVPADPLDAALAFILPGGPGKWGGYAGRPLGEVPSHLLVRVGDWALDNATILRDEGKHDVASKLDALNRDCLLIVEARAAGTIEEPPHKDGTPREGKATGEAEPRMREPGED